MKLHKSLSKEIAFSGMLCIHESPNNDVTGGWKNKCTDILSQCSLVKCEWSVRIFVLIPEQTYHGCFVPPFGCLLHCSLLSSFHLREVENGGIRGESSFCYLLRFSSM